MYQGVRMSEYRQFVLTRHFEKFAFSNQVPSISPVFYLGEVEANWLQTIGVWAQDSKSSFTINDNSSTMVQKFIKIKI